MWNKTEEKKPEQNKLVLGYWCDSDEEVYRLCYQVKTGTWYHPLNGQKKYECPQGVMSHDFDDHPKTTRRICPITQATLEVSPPDWWIELPPKPIK